VQVKKSWVAAVSSVTFLAACTQGPSPSGSAPAASAGTSPSASVASLPAGSGPVTIQCGDGKQAVVKQVLAGAQTVSQVECVDAARVVTSRDVALLEDQPLQVAPAVRPPVRRVVRTLPPVVRERVIVREVPRHEDDEDVTPVDEPRVYRTSDTSDDDPSPAPAPAPSKRSGEQSAVIIGGSTAAGAGVGAVLGGKKGAIIGAVLGGIGGTIYDRKTREKK
jgi:hypothetical protein